MVIAHTDLQAMKDLDGIGIPDMTVSDEEFYAAGGLARIISGQIFLGKTDTEKRAEKEAEVRTRRNKILLETIDRMNSIRWEAMPNDRKIRWRAYRQALLDIPEQDGFPFTVVWPELPE